MELAAGINIFPKRRVARKAQLHLRQLFLSVLLIALTFRIEADPAEVGEWGPLIEGFPVPAVHSLMLHTGKILFFRGDGEDEGGVGADAGCDPGVREEVHGGSVQAFRPGRAEERVVL